MQIRTTSVNPHSFIDALSQALACCFIGQSRKQYNARTHNRTSNGKIEEKRRLTMKRIGTVYHDERDQLRTSGCVHAQRMMPTIEKRATDGKGRKRVTMMRTNQPMNALHDGTA